MPEAALSSWNDGAPKAAIVEFVKRVSTEGGHDFVPPNERVAVFDNDGTLWCEKPMPIELGFILLRLAAMAVKDQAFGGMSVDDYCAASHEFLTHGTHPTLKRVFRDCGYKPMVDLLRYLEANGFATFIASAGDLDFMRTVTTDIYGVPP